MSSPPAPQPLGLLVKTWPKLSETFILEEVLGLERRGLTLRLYALGAPTDPVVHADVQRVRAPVTVVPATIGADPLRVAGRHLRLLAANPLRYARAASAALRRGRGAWRDFVRAGWLAGQLRADGVGHLHTHWISTPADIAECVSALGGVPFSISAHAKDIYLSDPADLRRKLGAARFTVTCTEFNCRTLRAVAPHAPVHRMYHGVDACQFHPGRRSAPPLVPRLLAIGRLREKKGFDTLVDACRLLSARGVPFSCDIVGYGEQEDSLRTMIDGHGLQGQVRLRGRLVREQVLQAYAEASVFVQPSRVAGDGDRDGIPNVLLEAMACGVPVVATRVSGIPEAVRDGHNGLLVEPDDASALADAVQRLIDDAALGARLAQAGRTMVTEHFDNDRNLQLVLRLLENRDVRTQTCVA